MMVLITADLSYSFGGDAFEQENAHENAVYLAMDTIKFHFVNSG